MLIDSHNDNHEDHDNDRLITKRHLLNAGFSILHESKHIFVVQTDAGMSLTNPHTLPTLITEQQLAANNTPIKRYGEFNLGLHVHDDPKQVLKNRATLLANLNLYLNRHTFDDPKNPASDFKNSNTKTRSAKVTSIHWLDQIHSNQVVDVNYKNKHEDQGSLRLQPLAADAQICSRVGQALAIMTADCVPIVIYNTLTGQIAAIHAGWQGLANGIIKNTMDKLMTCCPNVAAQSSHNISNQIATTQNYSAPVQWQAWIGACICQQCYEVSADVVDKMVLGCASLNINRAMLYQNAIKAHHSNKNKAWLDLASIAAIQLEQFGVVIQKHSYIKDSSQKHPSLKYLADQHKVTANITPYHKYHSFKLDKPSQKNLNDNKSCVIDDNQTLLRPAFACSYHHSRYYSYRRMTHLQQNHTGRMALVIVRLQ